MKKHGNNMGLILVGLDEYGPLFVIQRKHIYICERDETEVGTGLAIWIYIYW